MSTDPAGTAGRPESFGDQPGPYFGRYGGTWMPESLMAALTEVTADQPSATGTASSGVGAATGLCLWRLDSALTR